MTKDEMESKIVELTLAVETLTARVTELEGQRTGPKSERPMTDADAYRVKFGDHKLPMKHKPAAESLGLSYGQVFSCRQGYTFKHVREDGTWNPDGTKKPKNGGAK